MRTLRFAVLAAMFLLPVGCAAETESDDANADSADEALYADKPFLWKTHAVPVCWVNPHDTTAMHWVHDAVDKPWAAHANVRFTGWGTCDAATDAGHVRIQIDESHPRSDIGNGIPATGPSMWLNFKFDSWGTACKKEREYCIRAIAVHEFGHVLGFAHEQERPDTPAKCKVSDARDDLGAAGLELGPYDGHSVMNYCNPIWNNNGNLSARDIAGVRKIYGAPK